MGAGESKLSKEGDLSSLKAPELDFSKASFQGDYVKSLQSNAQSVLDKAKSAAERPFFSGWIKTVTLIIGTVLAIVGILYAYDAAADTFGWPGIFPGSSVPSSTLPPVSDILYIDSAIYANDKANTDVTSFLENIVSNNKGKSLPTFVVSYTSLGLATPLPTGTTPNTLLIKYHLGGDYPNCNTVSKVDGEYIPTLPQGNEKRCTTPSTNSVSSTQSSGGFFSGLFGAGGGSDLLGKLHDATTSMSVPASSAPLSNTKNGSYGMQWWMFVNDWNYGYGKKKDVIKRADTTSSSVFNPHISLHPTDNTLTISVSVFPDETGKTSKTEPAPANGGSGATDDVFVCEIPNIPLQAWFAVSMTVFDRNMDVYIDGRLVKSCFLSGVPKPAVGDIQVTPNGGYSGYMCGLSHMPRMITPGDSMNFFAAGTSCTAPTAPTTSSKMTGYAVKFGVYDTTGKEINEYTF